MTAIAVPDVVVPIRRVPLRRVAWVTWRQHRPALAGAVALLGALGVYLLYMGLEIHRAYAAVATCHPANSVACHQLARLFKQAYYGSQQGSVVSSGINAQILGDNGLGTPQTLASPTAAKGAQCGLFAEPWYIGSTAGGNPQFVKDWEAANKGQQPDLFNALGHDAMWGMATAIKQANSTNGQSIRTALANLKANFSGALGAYKWASDGQPTYKVVTMQVNDGKAVVWTPASTCAR